MTAAICSAAHADASATMNADGCRMTRRAMRPDGRDALLSAPMFGRVAARQPSRLTDRCQFDMLRASLGWWGRMRSDQLKRRKFISLLGGAAAWPLGGARAQQPAMPVIGFLNSGSLNAYSTYLAGFRRGLRETGYVEGQNVAIEFRWAEGRYDQLPVMAADLVRRQVAVIFAAAFSAIAAKAATSKIPIVFGVGDDPVRLGLVASLNHPGGNATGFNLMIDEMESKRLGLLRDLVPQAALIAVLLNPGSPAFETQLAHLQTTARSVGQRILVLRATSVSEIDAAFAALTPEVGALLFGSDPFFATRREQLVGLAARHAIPAIYNDRLMAAAGGLISYGIDIPEGYRQGGNYVGRILRGEKPADLPVVRPAKYDLVINLKTARMLGFQIPPGVLAIADEVIE
jgi:putative ABC transport system substrate-binding protein